MSVLKKFLSRITNIFRKKRRRKSKGKPKTSPQKRARSRQRPAGRKKISSKRKRKVRVKRKAKGKAKPRKKLKPRSRGQVKKKSPATISSPGKKGEKGAREKQKRTSPAFTDKTASKEILSGEITHYFSRIMVCVVKVTGGSLRVGDLLHIRGPKTDFVQKIESLQIESVDVPVAPKGKLAGLKVRQEAREGDRVYKVQ
ncbi:MAG: hypothetical protein WC552_00075 [Candidatus Omnitrophota bacterium]